MHQLSCGISCNHSSNPSNSSLHHIHGVGLQAAEWRSTLDGGFFLKPFAAAALPEHPVLHVILSCLCCLVLYWLSNTHQELLWFYQGKKQVNLTYFLCYAMLPQNVVQVRTSGFFVFRHYYCITEKGIKRYPALAIL